MKDSSDPRRGYHGVDFDGTLARYEGWEVNGDVLGEPVPAMLARVLHWRRNGEDVRIITARAAVESPNHQRDVIAIGDWCERHVGERLPVQAHKCFRMIDLWDDRAVSVEMNTGYRLARTGEMAMRHGDPLTGLQEIELDEGTICPRTLSVIEECA